MTIEAPRIIPTFRYRDPERMIRFLEDVFGFTPQAIHRGESMIEHAELSLGSCLVMVGPVRDDAYGRMVGGPGENGGKSLYVVVEDPDALFERVREAGAVIEEEPVDRAYGSREFICRDPEGNVWSFGTYWPKVQV